MNTCKCWTAVLVGTLLLPNVAKSADTAAEACQKGESCLDKEDFDAAISAYTEAIRLDAKLAEGYGGRGFAYSKKGDLDKAIADYTEAIRLDPKDAEAYWRAGRCVPRQGRLRQGHRGLYGGYPA